MWRKVIIVVIVYRPECDTSGGPCLPVSPVSPPVSSPYPNRTLTVPGQTSPHRYGAGPAQSALPATVRTFNISLSQIVQQIISDVFFFN